MGKQTTKPDLQTQRFAPETGINKRIALNSRDSALKPIELSNTFREAKHMGFPNMKMNPLPQDSEAKARPPRPSNGKVRAKEP